MKHIHVVFIAIFFLAVGECRAQSLPGQWGINPGQSYIHSPIDSVNMSTGNLVLHIPLISYKQRGDLPDFTLELGYNNKTWQQETFPTYPEVGIQGCLDDWLDYDPPCSYTQWVWVGGAGVQVVRGNTLVTGALSYPDPYDEYSSYPTDFNVFTISDSSGASSTLYGAPVAPPYEWSPTLRTMDGTGVLCVNGPNGCTDSKGIFHSTSADSAVDIPLSVGFADEWSDKHGNAITEAYDSYGDITSWTDSLGRHIPAPVSDYIQPHGCNTFQYPAQNAGTVPYTFCYQQLSFSSNFGLSYVEDWGYTFPALSAVILPNGTSYQFTYNSWGDLSTITLPSGGTISYQWQSSPGIPAPSCNAPSCQYWERIITSRTLNANDGTPPKLWTYSGGVATDPLGNQTVYSGGAPGADPTTVETHYQGLASDGKMLESIVTCRKFQEGFTSGSDVFFTDFGFIPGVTIGCGTTTTLSNGLVSTVTETYDPPTLFGDPLNQQGNRTALLSMGIPLSRTETDYGTGVPGPVLRTTNTIYQWQLNDAYKSANLLQLPGTVTVLDGNRGTLSQRSYGYDENNGSPQGVYGNRTSTNSWLNTTGQWLKTTTKYNTQGMPTDSYDANWNAGVIGEPGNHVNIGYDSTGLFPSTVTQSATRTAHVEYFNYDANTGLMNWHTDQNGSGPGDAVHTTSWSYDNMRRPTIVAYPDGGGSTYCYTDEGGSMCSQTSAPYSTFVATKIAGSEVLTSNIGYDGLGEVTSTTAPDGAVTEMLYDQLGRVSSISNPYVGTGSPDQWTITSYDALGRKLSVVNPDGSSRNTTYAGNVTTYTDESGNSSQQTTDALGRLTKVLEPSLQGSSTTVFGAETDYTYDTLDNLQTVTQLGLAGDAPRTRRFTYDSLSRLVTSTNPETGTTCYGLLQSSACSGGYDANGNLVYKTDARGVLTNYSYDSLNRITSKSYTSPSSVATTASSTYTYDAPSSGTVPNAIGHLVEEYTGPASAPYTQRTIINYDPMGRVWSEQQCVSMGGCTSANTYSLNYQYDLAGDLTYSTNGVSSPAIGLTYGYDGAARLQTVTSSLSNGAAYPSTLFAPPSAGAQYGPYGLIAANLGMTNENTQPAFQLSRTYDNRLRVTSETDLGTVLLNAATPSTGQILIVGSEQQGTSQPAAATGTITITGVDRSHLVCITGGPNPGPVSPLAQVNSALSRSGGGTTCSTIYDTGSLTATVNGFAAIVSYGALSNDATVASGIATALNLPGSPVTATSNGSIVTITSNVTGPAGNYAYSVTGGADFNGTTAAGTMTGGSNGGPISDAGTVTATINGTAVTISWDSGSTASSIASQLASQINTQLGSVVTANPNGSTVQLTSVGTGSSANGAVSVSVLDTTNAFSTPSFSVSANGLTGGTDAGSSLATVYSYLIPSGGYAPNGNLLSVSDSVTGNWNYQYDTLNRLSSAQAGMNLQGMAPYGTGMLRFSYDSFGNFQGQTLTGNSPATVTQAVYTFQGQSWQNGVPLSGAYNNRIDGYNYDSAGNQLNVPGFGLNTYVYDAEGRVASVTGSTQYIYDATGGRVGKVSNGVLTNIYLLGPGAQQVTELNTSTGSMAWAHSNVYASGRLLATYDNKGAHFEFSDWIGTKRVQAGANGNIEETCVSLPFGDNLNCSGLGSDATEQHFTGKERDTESGLDYFGARYYASSMGRFMSPDPYSTVLIKQHMVEGGLPQKAAQAFFDGFLENPQKWNEYSYALNNPLRFTDPTGAAPAEGHHLIPERGSISSPLGRDFANSIKSGRLSGNGSPNQPGFNGDHRAYNNAVGELLDDTEKVEGDCNNWSVSQWKDFANKILNSDDPAIKNFLDQLEHNNPGAKAALSASIGAYQISKALALRMAAQAAAAAAAAAAGSIMNDFIICFTCSIERVTTTIHYGPQPPG